MGKHTKLVVISWSSNLFPRPTLEAMLCFMLLLAAFHLNSALKASCGMKVGNGAEIGRATLSSEGSSQNVRLNIRGDPLIVKEGNYKLKIHDGSCGDALGDVYNDNFSTMEAGERGEINFSNRMTIKPGGGMSYSSLGRPLIHCGPYLEKIWSDGRREVIYGEQIEVEKRGKKNKKGKKKGCSKRKAKKGKCKPDSTFELGPTFQLIEHNPDCYVPMSQNINMQLEEPSFAMEGDQSVVGGAAVLHAKDDDSVIACCTLQLE